jgi:FLVCR family feline leukemia virus subgroup C receptor-related protein
MFRFGFEVRVTPSLSFYWILLGQTLSGIGRPFILNSQASIAQNWFPAEQRTQIVTLLNFMITFSGILGQIVPSIFFGGYKTEDDDADFSVGKAKFERLLLLESALVIVFMVPTYFVMKSNPPTPPSHFANKNTKLNFSESLRGLFTDRKFVTQ